MIFDARWAEWMVWRQELRWQLAGRGRKILEVLIMLFVAYHLVDPFLRLWHGEPMGVFSLSTVSVPGTIVLVGLILLWVYFAYSGTTGWIGWLLDYLVPESLNPLDVWPIRTGAGAASGANLSSSGSVPSDDLRDLPKLVPLSRLGHDSPASASHARTHKHRPALDIYSARPVYSSVPSDIVATEEPQDSTWLVFDPKLGDLRPRSAMLAQPKQQYSTRSTSRRQTKTS